MGAQINRALIFGAAPCKDWAFLTGYLREPVRVFCADGGIRNAKAAGLFPDVLIGDWDSGGAPISGISCITLPTEKDMTDLQAAAGLALHQGCTELILCGCTGGTRLDHTLSNMMLMEWIADQGGHSLLIDGDNEARLLDRGKFSVRNQPCFRYLSLVPLDRQITGVSLYGLKYPLHLAVLNRGDTLSVSNEPSSEQMEISIGTGRLLLIRSERQ